MSGWNFDSPEDERLWAGDDARREWKKGIRNGIPIKCDGQQDENGNADCEGPNVMRFRVTLPGDKTFQCNYCVDCANECAQYAVTLIIVGQAVRE